MSFSIWKTSFEYRIFPLVVGLALMDVLISINTSFHRYKMEKTYLPTCPTVLQQNSNEILHVETITC